MADFNLVDDSWLRVQPRGGTVERVGLMQVLTMPEEYTSIVVDEVDELFALTRLLTTIVNRALHGPRTPSDWAGIAQGPGYDVAAIRDYLKAHRARFSLFDSERPFLQFAQLAGGKVGSVLQLLPTVASGNAVTLFSHTAERDGVALTPAEAACALVHVVLNGRGSLKSGEYGLAGARVVVVGDSVRDLVVENLPRYRGERQDGLPVWEREAERLLPADPRKQLQPCRGVLDFATWQWRAVHLRCDPDGLVRSCVFGPGLRPAGEEPVDPARWYDVPTDEQRKKKPDLPGRVPHRLRADRALWRDADALVVCLASRDTPGVLAWNVDQRHAPTYEVIVGGPILERKGSSWVVTGTATARLPIPRALLVDELVVQRIAEAVGHATTRGRQLDRAAFVLARELVRQSPDEEPSKRRADHLVGSVDPTPRYWASLPAAFSRFLRGGADPLAAELWRGSVDEQARRALAEVLTSLTGGPRALRAAAAARRRLETAMSGASDTTAEGAKDRRAQVEEVSA